VRILKVFLVDFEQFSDVKKVVKTYYMKLKYCFDLLLNFAAFGFNFGFVLQEITK